MDEKRLVDANKLHMVKFKTTGMSYQEGWNDAVDAIIENAPTVDAVEVVHSHWCWNGRFKACAKCGSYVEFTETLGASFWKFCPFCGAKMDGGMEYV